MTEREAPQTDGPLAALAEVQHGVVGRAQLRDLGFDRSGIDSRVRRRALLPIHMGVYAVGHRRLTSQGRWMAAVLSCGKDAALSHRSAAQLWGIVPRSPNVSEVTRPRSFRPRGGVRCHREALPADEIEKVDGIPVTLVSRTLLDLAGVVSRRRLELAFNQAEVLHLTSRVPLATLLERHPRRSGSASLRRLVRGEGAFSGVVRNDFEESFLALIDASGLPRPRLNADVAVRGRFFEVDCLWDRQRLAVELDGRAVHGTRRAFEQDRERDRILLTEGWRVMHISWWQLRDEPEAVALDLRRLLRL